MTDPAPRKSVRQWGLVALLVLLGAAGGWWAFAPRPLPVEVAVVAVGRFEQSIQADGRLRVRERYQVSAPISAELERSALAVGDRVAAGQVVARLRPVAPSLIDARSRVVLLERVGSAEAAQLAALAEVERVQAALAQARLEANRAARLAAERFLAESAREQAALALETQITALRAAQARVHVAEHALGEARAALARSQRAETDDSRTAALWLVKAPVAGRVLKIHQESGGPLALGQPIIEIGDTDQLEAVVDLLSADALRVPSNGAVRVSLGASVAPLTGHVVRIEPVAFTKVSALGIEEQRVNVVIALDALPVGGAVGDGFRVEAALVVTVEPMALLVPTAALVRAGTRWAVMRLETGRARRVEVDVRARTSELAWIDQPLRPGERVVLYPGTQIRDGQRIAVR